MPPNKRAKVDKYPDKAAGQLSTTYAPPAEFYDNTDSDREDAEIIKNVVRPSNSKGPVVTSVKELAAAYVMGVKLDSPEAAKVFSDAHGTSPNFLKNSLALFRGWGGAQLATTPKERIVELLKEGGIKSDADVKVALTKFFDPIREQASIAALISKSQELLPGFKARYHRDLAGAGSRLAAQFRNQALVQGKTEAQILEALAKLRKVPGVDDLLAASSDESGIFD